MGLELKSLLVIVIIAVIVVGIALLIYKYYIYDNETYTIYNIMMPKCEKLVGDSDGIYYAEAGNYYLTNLPADDVLSLVTSTWSFTEEYGCNISEWPQYDLNQYTSYIDKLVTQYPLPYPIQSLQQ